MSLLAVRIGAGVLALLALLTLRGKRWAYFAFVVLGLLYFPAQTHFRVHVPKCELLLPTVQMLVPLLHNYAYIALFAGFYWMSWVQFRDANARGVWALVATLLAGALFEIAQGITAPVARAGARAAARAAAAAGPCSVRDLVPYVAGAVGAALLLAIWSRLTRKPAYVRLVKPRSKAAPQPAAPTAPRVVVPSRGVPPPPPAPPSRIPPPPPDFSPGPEPVEPAADLAPTHEVAPKDVGARVAGGAIAARRAVVQRLQAILGRLREMLQRPWMTIRRRRRAVIVGVGVLALAGAGAFVILSLPAPAPVVTEEPAAPPEEPPPPPPRPLQSEAEGYYVPSYMFTVSDRRFTRLTLRPEPFVTFSRPGIRDEVGCADARITALAAHLRCEFERVGIVVTIDGQFPQRSVTSRLDAPVLNAWITITNTRGETVFRARESFLWHTPD